MLNLFIYTFCVVSNDIAGADDGVFITTGTLSSLNVYIKTGGVLIGAADIIIAVIPLLILF